MKNPSQIDYTTSVLMSIQKLAKDLHILKELKKRYNIDVPVYDFLIYLLKEKSHKSYAEIKELMGLKSRGVVQYKVNKIKKIIKNKNNLITL